MKPWWESWPGRREAELAAFDRHGLSFEPDEEQLRAGRLVMRGVLDVDGEAVELVVGYPDPYPYTRFVVSAPGLDLERHQHPFGKNLCAFPRSSAHWDRRFLAADIIVERVPELIRLVRAGGDALRSAEDPQGEPFTDYYRYWPFGGILVPDTVIGGARGLEGGQFSVRMASSADWLEVLAEDPDLLDPIVGQGVVQSVGRGSDELGRADDRLLQGFTGPVWTGRWVRVETPPRTAEWDVFVNEVLAAAPALRMMKYSNGTSASVELLAVVFEDEVRQGEFDDAWVFVVLARKRRRKQAGGKGKRKSVEQQPATIALVRGMRAGRSDLAERIPELAACQSRTVALAGLGTLGSPLAREMARSLVKELRILDFDFVEAGTAVRWSAGFSAAGALKPLALFNCLRRDYPYTRVQAFPHAIGTPTDGAEPGDRDVLAQWSSGADLLIDATAEDNVNAALAHLAQSTGTPAVFLWSVEGLGGVVARIVPGETGCYHCLELHLSPEQGNVLVPSPPERRRRVQPRGCADPTFTSPAPDLLPLVDTASRVALGELCRGVDAGYPRYENDIHVLFLRHPDGSLYEPIRWEAHKLTVHPECRLCNAPG